MIHHQTDRQTDRQTLKSPTRHVRSFDVRSHLHPVSFWRQPKLYTSRLQCLRRSYDYSTTSRDWHRTSLGLGLYGYSRWSLSMMDLRKMWRQRRRMFLCIQLVLLLEMRGGRTGKFSNSVMARRHRNKGNQWWSVSSFFLIEYQQFTPHKLVKTNSKGVLTSTFILLFLMKKNTQK